MKKSLSKVMSGVIGAALLSLGSGCFFPAQSTPVTVYSPRSSTLRSVLPVRLGVIRNISGAGRELLVRQGDDRVTAEPGRLWLDLPEVMLERSFRERFNTTGSTLLNMVICRQEITAADNILHYTVLFEMISPRGERREICCRAATAVKNGDAGRAMSENLNKILDEMEKYILEQKIK